MWARCTLWLPLSSSPTKTQHAQEGHSKDNANHAGRNELDRQHGSDAAVRAIALYAFSIIDRQITRCFVQHYHQPRYYQDGCQNDDAVYQLTPVNRQPILLPKSFQ